MLDPRDGGTRNEFNLQALRNSAFTFLHGQVSLGLLVRVRLKQTN